MYTPSTSVNTAGVGNRDVWVAALKAHGAGLAEQIVGAYIQYAPLAGKNYDIALAQACLECTWFTDWKWVQRWNPAGLGSTDRSALGLSFPNPEAGITAQYAHQCAYANTPEDCPIEKMGADFAALFNDARHALVGHQGQPAMSRWNGRWAVPGDQYAQDICAILQEVLGDVQPGAHPPSEPASAPPPVSPPPASAAPRIVDLRPVLYRNPDGGPNYQDDAKVGTVTHYNGLPPNEDAHVQYVNDAVYHAHEDWGGGARGDGIMYHYGIQSGPNGSDPDGTIYRLRDEADVLWHCAAWVPGGNATGIAINVNIGQGQNASEAALASWTWLLNDIARRRGVAQDMNRGHQELSPTACPGTLMDDAVIPYREGRMTTTVQPQQGGDGTYQENGFVIGGGFAHRVAQAESVSHEYRMKMIGYVLSNEGDGYLLSPEFLDNGVGTGRYHVKKVVLQHFERTTLIHEADEPNPDWQDVVPLFGRGFLVGFADEPVIDAVLKNPKAQVS